MKYMANEREIGNLVARVTIDGTGFQNGVGSLNRQLKIVQSEFQVASAKLSQFGGDAEQLKLKADALNKQLEIQKQKVAALQQAYEKSVQTKGADARATQDLQIKLLKAQKTEADLENALRQTNKELGEQDKRSEKLQSSLGRIATVLAGVATAVATAAGGIVAFGIKGNAEMEQLKIGFTTMLGSAKAADAFLKEMEAFAAKTPFEFDDVKMAAQRFLALGFNARDVIPMLTAVGNAAAGLGGGKEVINGIVLALGQMKSKAKVSADELNQMAERGIPAYEILREKLNLSAKEMENIGKAGIDADKAIAALIQGMNEKFKDMMLKQSETFLGRLSTLKDELKKFLKDVTGPLFEKLRVGLGDLLKYLDKIKKDGTLQEWKDKAAKAFDIVGNVVAKVTGFLITFAKYIYDNWPQIKTTLITVATAIGTYLIIEKIIQLTKVWREVNIALTSAQWLLNAALKANPIGIIISAVAALAAALIHLYRTNATVRFYLQKAWYGLAAGVLTAIKGLLGGLEKAFSWVPGLGEKLAAAQAKVSSSLEQVSKKYQSITKESVAADLARLQSQEKLKNSSKDTEEALKKAYEEAERKAKEAAKAAQKAADATKKSGTAAKDAAKKQKEAAKETSDAWKKAGDRIKLEFDQIQKKALDAFRAKQKLFYDQQEAKYDSRVADIEKQIEAIDAEQQAEDDARREKERQDRIAEVKERISKAYQEGDIEQAKDYEKDLQGIYDEAEAERRQKAREAAQKALEDKIRAIEAEKETYLKNLEQQQEREEKAFIERQEKQKLQFEQELKNIIEQNTKRHTKYDEGLKDINKLLEKWQKEMYDSGSKAGSEFARGLESQQRVVAAAAASLAAAMAGMLELHSPAKEGPLATLDKWWTSFSDTLLKGFDATAIKTALTMAVSPPAALRLAFDGADISGSARSVIVQNQITVTGNHLYNEADEDRLATKISQKIAGEYFWSKGGTV